MRRAHIGTARRLTWPVLAAVLAVACWPAAAQPLANELLTPQWTLSAELLPGVLRVYGCDLELPPSGEADRVAPFTVTLYLECLDGVPDRLERELLFHLGGMDMARLPLVAENLAPGKAFRQTFSLRVPRGAELGEQELRCGFVERGAHGESLRVPLTERMAPLATVTVAPAPPVEAMSAAEKESLLQEFRAHESANLVANGGFEAGLQRWDVDVNLRDGLRGWSRVLRLNVDTRVFLTGQNALRIDFGGGQDPNFIGPYQYIAVKPSTTYTVSYFVRTEHLTSAQGLTLGVWEPGRSQAQFHATPDPEFRYTGTREWTRVTFRFTTFPETERIGLRVRRYGSGADDYSPELFGPIGGSAWLDGIQLYEAPPRP